MTTMPSDSIDVARDLDVACRWGIRIAWRLSLVWGALVSLLAWTGGAEAITAVIRGAVAFLAVGLIGWGVNAVMAHAGARDAMEAATHWSAEGADGSNPADPTGDSLTDEAMDEGDGVRGAGQGLRSDENTLE